jgi:PPOX class probable F420-dependent enzyme
MEGGAPKVDPVWVDVEGDRVLVATDAKSIKAVNVERDPRVALSVIAFDNPYDQVLVRGRVVEVRGDHDMAALDGLSQKYLGGPFPRRRWSKRVVLVIEPDVARHYRSSLRHRPAHQTGAPP